MKNNLDISFQNQSRRLPNEPKGYAKLIARVQRQDDPVRLVAEATGPYHAALLEACQNAGLELCLVNATTNCANASSGSPHSRCRTCHRPLQPRQRHSDSKG